MSGLEARRDEIAQRYGNVLFDVAQENKQLKPILKDVHRLHQCIQEEPHAWMQVVSPTVIFKTQTQMIEKLSASLKLQPLMHRFLMVLCENHRLRNLKSSLEEFMALNQAAEGIVEGTLETPAMFSQKEIEALEESLRHKLDKTVSLNQEVKECLLAGVVLRLGSLMIDASVGTQLKKLRQEMKG